MSPQVKYAIVSTHFLIALSSQVLDQIYGAESTTVFGISPGSARDCRAQLFMTLLYVNILILLGGGV